MAGEPQAGCASMSDLGQSRGLHSVRIRVRAPGYGDHRFRPMAHLPIERSRVHAPFPAARSTQRAAQNPLLRFGIRPGASRRPEFGFCCCSSGRHARTQRRDHPTRLGTLPIDLQNTRHLLNTGSVRAARKAASFGLAASISSRSVDHDSTAPAQQPSAMHVLPMQRPTGARRPAGTRSSARDRRFPPRTFPSSGHRAVSRAAEPARLKRDSTPRRSRPRLKIP